MCCEILKIILDFLSVLLEVGAIVFAIIEFSKFKKENYKNRIKVLKQEVAAYYCMADYMAEEIFNERKSKGCGGNINNIKTEFKNKAKNHQDNIAQLRPSKTAKDMYK